MHSHFALRLLLLSLEIKLLLCALSRTILQHFDISPILSEMELTFLGIDCEDTEWKHIVELGHSNQIALSAFHHNYFHKYDNRTRSMIFVCPNNISQLLNLVDLNSSVNHWQPYYFIIWPEQPEQGNEVGITAKISNLLRGHNFTLQNNFFFIFKSNVRQIAVFEIYDISDQRIIRKVELNNGKLWMGDIHNKLQRRQDFQKRIVKVAGVNDSFFENEVKFNNRTSTVEFESGFGVHLIAFLADSLNFTIKPKSAVWGIGLPDGSDNIYGLIATAAIDISITEFAGTPTTKERCTILQPTHSMRYMAVFKQPPSGSIRDVFISSFKMSTWAIIFLTWAIIVATLDIFVWLRWRITASDPQDCQIARNSKIWGFGALCQQGWSIQTESISLRVIFFIGNLYGLLCLIAFAGTIVASLSVKQDAINDFGDLVQNAFEFATSEASWPRANAVISNMGMTLKETEVVVWDEVIAMKCMTSRQCAYLTALDELHAAIDIVEMQERVFCDTYSLVPVAQVYLRYSMLMPLNSQFTEFFNWRILRMIETGLVRRYKIEFEAKGTTRCGKLEQYGFEKSRPCRFGDITTAYFILALGFVLGTVVLVREKIAVHRNKISN